MAEIPGDLRKAGRSDCNKQVNIFMKGFTPNFGLVSSRIQDCFRSIISSPVSVARSTTLYGRMYARMPRNKVRLNASLTKRRVAGSEPKLLLFYYDGKKGCGELEKEARENGHFDQNVAPAQQRNS